MRKSILLAMVAAIVAMFAIPGSASASWTKHHVALAAGTNIELEITGTDMFFETEVGGITCGSTISNVVFEGGTTTGTVKSFAPETGPTTTITQDCQGRGLIAQCDVHEATAHPRAGSGGTDPQDLRWIIHTVGKNTKGEATVSVTTGTITTTLTGFFCPHTLSLTPGTLHLSSSEALTTSTMTLSGSLLTDGDLGNGIATTFSGTCHVLGTITYGI